MISDSNAQAIVEPCISDASLQRNDLCPWETTNYGANTVNLAATWTWYGPGCGPGDIRSVIQFNIDTVKPKKLYDNRATLDLYYPTGSTQTNTFVGSATENSFRIEHVTSPWSEMAVTWNTQPTSTLVGSLIVPTTAQNDTANLQINVSTIVDDWICGLPNYGVKLSLVNEGLIYRRRYYTSREYANTTLRPTLTLQYAEINAQATPTICSGGSINLSCLLTNAAIPGDYNFQWEHLNSSTTYNGQNITNANYVVGTNTYVVTVTNPYCQWAKDTVVVIVDSAYTSTQNSMICEGDSILIGGIYQYTAGVYYDTLTTLNGCDSIITTTLTINPAIHITQNAAISAGDSIFLGGAYQSIAGVYYDTLNNIGGCDSILITTLTVIIKEVEKEVEEYGIYVPNSFSPDGDALNDGFYPQGIGITKNNYSFMIFDRWGKLLFESHKVGQPWHGDYKGKLLPNDIYIWKFSFIALNGIKYEKVGHVNLLK